MNRIVRMDREEDMGCAVPPGVYELLKKMENEALISGADYRKWDRETLWDFIFHKFSEATEEQLNEILDYYLPRRQETACCLVCETPLNSDGDCPEGCTEDKYYGILEGACGDPEDFDSAFAEEE